MKRNLQVLALAAILSGTQAVANDTFSTGTGEWESIPARQTYADRHAAEIAKSPATKPFPLGSGEYESIPAAETYADRHRNDVVKQPFGSAFPSATESE